MADLSDPVLRLATGVRLWLNWARTDPVWCAARHCTGDHMSNNLKAQVRHASSAG